MAKKKQKYAIVKGKLVDIRQVQHHTKQAKQHDYTSEGLAQRIFQERKSMTGYGKDWSKSYIRHVIKETYYSEENEWQGKANTKARYEEVYNVLRKSEFMRSAGQRGRQNFYRNLDAWKQVDEFKALGGRMNDYQNLHNVYYHDKANPTEDVNTWYYETDDGIITLTVTQTGDGSMCHFDMGYYSNQEIEMYGAAEYDANPHSALAMVWSSRYGG